MTISDRPQPEAEGDDLRPVELVAGEVEVPAELLGEQERQYPREHTLKGQLRTRQSWALGVGAVITGEYFGWNGGLGVAGPIGMLLASLFVCALYMAWVLSLAELSVAMPFAGGAVGYRRRAGGAR